ncbi:MAG: hemerythrin family protein, partial [Leptospiraceae bacterium]|nr:hemerythrin family protein [Leptospiraceae bacterium]
IIDVLKSLIEYTKTHFVDEEKLMKDVAYPDREIHFREHEDFINEIYSDTAEFLQGKKLPTLRLAQYLYNWLLDHIMIHDKQIGLYIRENNIEIS